MFNTPVLFLIFNRADVAALVFERIKAIKPRKLYVAADGPRPSREGEKEQCELTRNIIKNGVDWECDLQLLFRDENLGCKYAVSGAINWFFENEEEGIILEDDCLPDLTFFSYCSTLLDKYKNNQEVMHISSNNFNDIKNKKDSSYYFSNYIEIWGWATWRRAWKLYDAELTEFNKTKDIKFMQQIFETEEERKYWINCFISSLEAKLDTWDYQWVYCIYKNAGIGITPFTNLVSNIGFGVNATHTTEHHAMFSNMKASPLSTIIHPKEIKISCEEDKLTYKNLYETKEFILKKVARKIINKNKNIYGVFKKLGLIDT